jgi:hypothetical protein
VQARHVTTGVTLLVLVVILGIGAFVGLRQLFAPLPDVTQPRPTKSARCSVEALKKGERVSTRQVEVSVYNAGTRPGLATRTMSLLTARGFRRGSVANAPRGSGVKVAQIWTTKRRDAAARLVAVQFGPAIKVKLKKTDLGPGVDVVVGDGFRRLARGQRAVVVRKAQSACLRAPR